MIPNSLALTAGLWLGMRRYSLVAAVSGSAFVAVVALVAFVDLMQVLMSSELGWSLVCQTYFPFSVPMLHMVSVVLYLRMTVIMVPTMATAQTTMMATVLAKMMMTITVRMRRMTMVVIVATPLVRYD